MENLEKVSLCSRFEMWSKQSKKGKSPGSAVSAHYVLAQGYDNLSSLKITTHSSIVIYSFRCGYGIAGWGSERLMIFSFENASCFCFHVFCSPANSDNITHHIS